MKASVFDYEQPTTSREAVQLLGATDRVAKVLAGGQSLGPMLNLRLAQPDLLIDVSRIPELRRAEDDDDAVVLGACVTHAAIEDGKVVDGTRGVMARVARGIAYRAVRNRGTIGGSLVHADPSADWISALAALDASVLIVGGGARRSVPVAEFMVGTFETVLAPDEIVEAIRIPKLSARARFGYYKVCRKPGEFAEAIAAVLSDADRDVRRAVLGATGSTPIVVHDVAKLVDAPASKAFDSPGIEAAFGNLLAERSPDDYAMQLHRVALRRALQQVRVQ